MQVLFGILLFALVALGIGDGIYINTLYKQGILDAAKIVQQGDYIKELEGKLETCESQLPVTEAIVDPE